jgi:hypothetical protein
VIWFVIQYLLYLNFKPHASSYISSFSKLGFGDWAMAMSVVEEMPLLLPRTCYFTNSPSFDISMSVTICSFTLPLRFPYFFPAYILPSFPLTRSIKPQRDDIFAFNFESRGQTNLRITYLYSHLLYKMYKMNRYSGDLSSKRLFKKHWKIIKFACTLTARM